MVDLGRLVDPKLARSTRRSEPASLSYVRSGPDGEAQRGCRTSRGGRLNDGFAWALAAWAEIAGRDPIFVVRRRYGSIEQTPVRPWRAGADSAWSYLEVMATERLGSGAARQMLADLERRGLRRP